MEKEKKILFISIGATIALGILVLVAVLIIRVAGNRHEELAKEKTKETAAVTEAAEKTSDDKKDEDKNENKSEKFTGELSATITETGSWGDSPVYKQYAVKINNTTSRDVDGWTIRINTGDATIDNSWNGNFEIKDGTLTVTNVDYNAQIPAG